jgi:hypothetical protein
MKVTETKRITAILQNAQKKTDLPPLEDVELDLEIDAFLANGSMYKSLFECATVVRVVVTEPQHGMVRSILFNAGHRVILLNRIRIGELKLGDMEVGVARAINKEDELPWFTQWSLDADGKLKEKMSVLYTGEQVGRKQKKHECREVVQYARGLAQDALQGARRDERMKHRNAGRRSVFWPENVTKLPPGSEEELSVMKESDIMAQDIKRIVAQKLVEYTDEHEKVVSRRALSRVTIAVNTVISADRLEEKKRVRQKKKKMNKMSLEREAMGKPPDYSFS